MSRVGFCQLSAIIASRLLAASTDEISLHQYRVVACNAIVEEAHDGLVILFLGILHSVFPQNTKCQTSLLWRELKVGRVLEKT